MLKKSIENPNIFGLSQRHADMWEGPGITNDKSDSGGITNRGVSLAYLKNRGSGGDLNRDGVVDANDVRAVTGQTQNRLFGEDFWDKPQLDKFPPRVAFSMYDAGVNCGAATAAKHLQKALGVKQDGVIGPATLKALEAYRDPRKDRELALQLCDLRDRRYDDIVRKYPKNRKYIKGWKNRTNSVRKFVNEYSWTPD